MQITWLRPASSASFRPTTSATSPPMPASTSSNTMVSTGSVSARIAFRARMILESSPPDAILERGFKASPTFGAIMNQACSAPFSDTTFPSTHSQSAVSAWGGWARKRVVNRVSAIFSSRSSASMCRLKSWAAAFRFSDKTLTRSASRPWRASRSDSVSWIRSSMFSISERWV
jgi:hypothetical protein